MTTEYVRHVQELRRSSASSPVSRTLSRSQDRRIAIQEGMEDMEILPDRHGGKLVDKHVDKQQDGDNDDGGKPDQDS